MMAETQTKSEVSATTTTITSPTYASPQKSSGISLCLEYFKTGPGIVKLVELVSTEVLYLQNHIIQTQYILHSLFRLGFPQL